MLTVVEAVVAAKLGGIKTFHNGNVTGDFAYTAEHFHYSVSLDEKKHAFTTSNELSRVTYLLIIYFLCKILFAQYFC